MLEQQETSIFEKNLRFVKNDIDEQLNEMFLEQKTKAPFKMVRPYPGLCVKAFKKGTKKKFFINICHTEDIPAPKDITENELHKLLENQNATDFKVPLSVTKPREGRDKNGNSVDVSDVAVNSEFFHKKIKHGDGLFYHFLITLIFESIEQKYQIEIDTESFILLKNRLCIDKLVDHQIYNRDVKSVEKYHEAQDQNELLGADGSEGITMSTESASSKSNKKVLIEEIVTKNPYKSIGKEMSKEPEHMLFVDKDQFNRKVFIAEFYMPDVLDVNEINVEANDDRLVIESQRRGYYFDKFLPEKVNESKIESEFDKERMILKITLST